MMTSPPTCHVCGGCDAPTENENNTSHLKSSLSHVSAVDILSKLLGLTSELDTHICSRCYNLLDSINSLQVQLKLKRLEVSNIYENYKAKKLKQTDTNLHQERNQVNNLTPAIKNKDDSLSLLVSEPPKKKDKGLLTSEDLKCQVCRKTFEKRRYLMDHLRRVHNSAVYQCNGCLTRFRLRETLTQHQVLCNQQLGTKPDPQSSLLIVPETQNILTKRKKNNKCQICEAYFLTKALLKTHLRTVHEGESLEDLEPDYLENETKVEAPVVCSVCSITVNNQYALSIHQGSVHGCERPWGCGQCGKTFARHLELVNHRRIHSGDKPFQCEVCGMRFNQKQNLHTHVRHIHLGERRYECGDCGMRFRRKRLLDCHTNSKHKNERPYTCGTCDARFVYPEHVRKHELTHRAVRDYTCGTCHKKFRTEASLSHHTSVSHKPANSYQCLSCPLYYLNKEELLTHLRETNHPRGVYSTQSVSSVTPVIKRRTIKTPALETVETMGVYDDVVILLEGVAVPEDGGATVFVEQLAKPEDEVQTAISSIVEVEQGELHEESTNC